MIQTSSPVPRSHRHRFLTAALATLALLASLLIGAAPAQAAYSITFTPGNRLRTRSAVPSPELSTTMIS